MLNRNTESGTEEYWKQTKVWYMPACGELGYIMPNFNVNNVALNNINSLYGRGVAVQLGSGYYYLSSSEYISNRVRCVGTGLGNVFNFNKDYNSYVRAFCALPA